MSANSDEPPRSDAHDSDTRRVCDILESIAARYADGSAEFEAIKDAAQAYAFLKMNQSLKTAYEVFIKSCRTGLTASQEQYLRDMGIDPAVP